MISPITILVSTDTFLIQRELTRLKKQFLSDDPTGLNLHRYSLKQQDSQSIINTAYEFPMLSAYRLIIADDVDALTKDEFELWEKYFGDPSSTTHLVLVAEKLDKRLKLWGRAVKSGWVKELKAPYDNQIPSWIMKEARRMGLNLSVKAAHALGDAIGANLMAIVSGLEKLALYTHPRTYIEIADVEAVTGSFLSQNVFKFVEVVGKRELKGALRLLDDMEVQGEPMVRLIFMLARHFRMLMLGKEGMESRMSEQDQAKAMGVHPFFVKDYLAQAKRWSWEQLKDIYRQLLEVDRASKRSPLPPRLILDKFIMGICI